MSAATRSTTPKKRSARKHSQEERSLAEAEHDDCKRFPYLLRKYCEERLHHALPETHSYYVRDDGQVIEVENQFYTPATMPVKSENILSVYANADMKLKKMVCNFAWAFSNKVLWAIGQAMLNFPTLTALQLDYCNLTSDHILILKESLCAKKTITELSLIGNPILNVTFYHLIQCGLKVLILKFCDIDKHGLEMVAKEYSSNYLNPPILAHLDLSFNKIFDEGCEYIATILRCDRALQSLNLTDCKITDTGFATLLASVSKFALTQDEIVIRRKIRMEYFKSLHGHEDVILYRDGKTSSEISKVSAEKPFKCHPFVADSFPENGEIFCTGNNTLESLNVAYNHLTKSGLDALLKTLMVQSGTLGSEKGIRRVVLEGNCRECDDVKTTIEDLLESRKLKIKSQSGSVKSRLSLRRRKSSAASSITSKDAA